MGPPNLLTHRQSFMAYQVLARKWRPHNFSQLVGQAHVVTSLSNALQNQRLHHAYLFTGTRGVGKTTVARILAKAMNCEALQGVNPCGVCDVCVAIDDGRFQDLIEVDAASRTKVEDTRDLLDNAQYAPNSGRYKVYLIDEVHMLSGHSFNALLKTLEEPPEHVKFLLATTDPHKIPVTVLSRCLQFNLKRLSPSQIAQQMEFILQQEALAYELPALKVLAQAADGSMRDGLSLLDQAIIFGNGAVLYTAVIAMLGTVAQQPIADILYALAQQNAAKLLTIVAEVAELSPDFNALLQQILQVLHRIAVYQVHAVALDAMEAAVDHEVIITLADQLSPADVQLYYQIALMGLRDLEFAPDPQSGFEMVMLRMLTFRPVIPSESAIVQATYSKELKLPTVNVQAAPKPLVTETRQGSAQTQSPETAEANWPNMIQAMKIEGLTRQLANNCILESIDAQVCNLVVDVGHQHLCGGVPEAKLLQALQKFTGNPLKLNIKIAQSALTTPAAELSQQRADKQQAAIKAIDEDENIQALKAQFGARVMPGTIEPL